MHKLVYQCCLFSIFHFSSILLWITLNSSAPEDGKLFIEDDD